MAYGFFPCLPFARGTGAFKGFGAGCRVRGTTRAGRKSSPGASGNKAPKAFIWIRREMCYSKPVCPGATPLRIEPAASWEDMAAPFWPRLQVFWRRNPAVLLSLLSLSCFLGRVKATG